MGIDSAKGIREIRAFFFFFLTYLSGHPRKNRIHECSAGCGWGQKWQVTIMCIHFLS